MNKEILIGKLYKLQASPSCYPDLKEAIDFYFDALGTPREKSVAEDLIAELKADVVPVEQLLIFAHSNRAIERFGAAGAKKFADNADALQRRGDKYCNCLACTLGLEILQHKDLLLGK